jgi:hypothetical protein
MPRGPKGEKRLRPPEMLCDGCESITAHDMGMVIRDGLTHSHTICRECGLEKIGGRVATRT